MTKVHQIHVDPDVNRVTTIDTGRSRQSVVSSTLSLAVAFHNHYRVYWNLRKIKRFENSEKLLLDLKIPIKAYRESDNPNPNLASEKSVWSCQTRF